MEQATFELLMRVMQDPKLSDIMTSFLTYRGRICVRDPAAVRRSVHLFLTLLVRTVIDQFTLRRLEEPTGSHEWWEQSISCLESAIDAVDQRDDALSDTITALYVLSQHPFGERGAYQKDESAARLNSLLLLLQVPGFLKKECTADVLLDGVDPKDVRRITDALDDCLERVRAAEVASAPCR